MNLHNLPEQSRGRNSTGDDILPRLILDLSGSICAFNPRAARLFGAVGNALHRRHIRNLIPELPLQSKTIGYNLAYVRMWYGDGIFRQSHGVRLDGQKVKLEIAITPLERRNQALLLVDALPGADDPESSGQKHGLDPVINKFFWVAMARNLDGVIDDVHPTHEALGRRAAAKAISRMRSFCGFAVHGGMRRVGSNLLSRSLR